MRKTNITLEDVKKIAALHGGECLAEVYVNARTKLPWKCGKCNYVWLAGFDTVKNRGYWCPNCAGNRKRTQMEIDQIISDKGGTNLEKYQNANASIKIRCTNNHEFKKTINKILNGAWCISCLKESITDKTKNCSICKNEKNRTYFNNSEYDNPNGRCTPCLQEYRKKYYDINKDYIVLKSKNWSEVNKDKKNETNRKYVVKKYATDPIFKIKNRISWMVRAAIKNNDGEKDGSITEYLPYTIEQLKQHLESLFEPWMTWDNHGKYDRKIWDDNNFATWTWNIDHIVPQSNFLYSSMADNDFQKCWALSNLRPYSAKQNLIDGNRK